MLTLKDHIARGMRPEPDEQILLARSALLPPRDQDLVLAVWLHGQPVRMLAGMSRSSPAAIRRRVRLLVRRLHSRDFVAVARLLRRLNPQQVAVARAHFLHGLSQRATARTTNLTYHRTRCLIKEVRGAMGAAVAEPPTGRPRTAERMPACP
jgi:DNA-directed RNA polymerase specialized sigma24 family protein